MTYIMYLLGLIFPYKDKNTRRQMYIQMYRLLEQQKGHGFCSLLEFTQEGHWIGRLWKLPELYKFRPFKWFPDDMKMWFPLDDYGYTTRLTILKNISKMKKLFVWYYKHDNTVCALDEDGKMIYTVISNDPANTIKTLFTRNASLLAVYDVKIQDQKKLEEHMYDGADRDYGVPKDFQVAWDKYRGIIYSGS